MRTNPVSNAERKLDELRSRLGTDATQYGVDFYRRAGKSTAQTDAVVRLSKQRVVSRTKLKLQLQVAAGQTSKTVA